MGWGSRLLHIGEMAAGVALIAGTGGAATPYAAGMIAGGAGGLVQDFAGDKAQKQQQAATTEAKKYGDQAIAEQRGLLGPYAQIGQGALSNLGALMGGGINMSAPSASGGAPMSASNLAALNQTTFGDPGTGNPSSDASGRRVPRVQLNPDGTEASDTPITAQTGSSFGHQGTVRLVAPDGTEQDVPQTLAQHYISRGARPAEGASA